MLQTGAKDDPPARDEFLELIDRESNRLTRLTHALLVLARAEAREEAPQSGRIDLRTLLDEVASGLSPANGVEIRVECDAGIAATGDRDLLEQAVTNLATNALRSTTSGAVVLSARNAPEGRVAIDVADTGTGMSADTQARAFDRFYRAGRADGGFGLGLSIARESVRALGGEVEIESTPGVGTTVRITLLAASSAEAA
jgi:signal transduction histidine kinase